MIEPVAVVVDGAATHALDAGTAAVRDVVVGAVGLCFTCAGAEFPVVVTDGAGRRVGYDPATNTEFQEVPGSAFFVDAMRDIVSGQAAPATTRSAILPQVATGTFTITGVVPGRSIVVAIARSASNSRVDLSERDATPR